MAASSNKRTALTTAANAAVPCAGVFAALLVEFFYNTTIADRSAKPPTDGSVAKRGNSTSQPQARSQGLGLIRHHPPHIRSSHQSAGVFYPAPPALSSRARAHVSLSHGHAAAASRTRATWRSHVSRWPSAPTVTRVVV